MTKDVIDSSGVEVYCNCSSSCGLPADLRVLQVSVTHLDNSVFRMPPFGESYKGGRRIFLN